MCAGFEYGEVDYTSEDDDSADDLQPGGDFAEEDGSGDSCDDWFAEFGCRYEGWGKVFEAPAEDGVSQEGGEYCE